MLTGTFEELDGLRVQVDRVSYQPELDAPSDQPHSFVYFISIINQSRESVTIQARKWVLRDVARQMSVVEGVGVVGETPTLAPGERFSYQSYHVIAANTHVRGCFFGLTESGLSIKVQIPSFELYLPLE